MFNIPDDRTRDLSPGGFASSPQPAGQPVLTPAAKPASAEPMSGDPVPVAPKMDDLDRLAEVLDGVDRVLAELDVA